MESENKYYIPKKEEFILGFKYEIETASGVWEEQIFNEKIKYLKTSITRAKILNKENGTT